MVYKILDFFDDYWSGEARIRMRFEEVAGIERVGGTETDLWGCGNVWKRQEKQARCRQRGLENRNVPPWRMGSEGESMCLWRTQEARP